MEIHPEIPQTLKTPGPYPSIRAPMRSRLKSVRIPIPRRHAVLLQRDRLSFSPSIVAFGTGILRLGLALAEVVRRGTVQRILPYLPLALEEEDGGDEEDHQRRHNHVWNDVVVPPGEVEADDAVDEAHHHDGRSNEAVDLAHDGRSWVAFEHEVVDDAEGPLCEDREKEDEADALVGRIEVRILKKGVD